MTRQRRKSSRKVRTLRAKKLLRAPLRNTIDGYHTIVSRANAALDLPTWCWEAVFGFFAV